MIFAVPRTMPLLGKKIQSECSRGTNILSYRFPMPLASSCSATNNNNNNTKDKENNNKKNNSDDNNDDDEEDDLRLQASCIYDQEEMRIYRMGK